MLGREIGSNWFIYICITEKISSPAKIVVLKNCQMIPEVRRSWNLTLFTPENMEMSFVNFQTFWPADILINKNNGMYLIFIFFNILIIVLHCFQLKGSNKYSFRNSWFFFCQTCRQLYRFNPINIREFYNFLAIVNYNISIIYIRDDNTQGSPSSLAVPAVHWYNQHLPGKQTRSIDVLSCIYLVNLILSEGQLDIKNQQKSGPWLDF